jgi:hypothetical protein
MQEISKLKQLPDIIPNTVHVQLDKPNIFMANSNPHSVDDLSNS